MYRHTWLVVLGVAALIAALGSTAFGKTYVYVQNNTPFDFTITSGNRPSDGKSINLSGKYWKQEKTKVYAGQRAKV